MLKIDLAKAFDMVEWSVVLDALQHKGFHSQFLELVHACISTMSYSVNVNGDSYGLVEASGKDVRFLHIFLSLLLMSFLLDYMMLWTMQHSLVFIWAQVAPN